MGIIWKANGSFHEDAKERGESLWIQKEYLNQEDQQILERQQLKGDVQTEVAVIGGGIAGILTAYLLQERGISVVVLECAGIGSGMTKGTTAKISSQHGLIYRKLLTYKGEMRAREYAAINQYSIEKYEDMIQQLRIDCDFQRLPNYIYTLDNDLKIKQEVEAAKRLGLPAVYTKDTNLPFPVKSAIRFDHQAQFHPLKFLRAVAGRLSVYEHVRIKEMRTDGLIITEQGTVKAKSVVIATHYPFINAPGYYFLRMHQERHYLAALEGSGKELMGMYLDADPQGFTFRNYQDYLILGSGGHRTGQFHPKDAYARIEMAAKQWYPQARIKYIWSAADCITPDSVPYIGRFSVNTPNFYVATGFNKWGMTGSMSAAIILRDMIMGNVNANRKVFNPRRFMLSGSKVMVEDAAISASNLAAGMLRIPHDKLRQIGRGQAGVIHYNGQRLGVYRDLNNKYYYVNTKCPHLGCSLEWNPNELSWDCPCHGSRFDYRGKWLNNPAMRDCLPSCLHDEKK